MRPVINRILVAVALAVLAGAAHAQVEVKDAWIRGMVAPQDTTGAFMQITSKTAARLVGVETPAAGMASIHQSKMEGDVMRMRHVEAIDLPPGKPVDLKPGGYHVMLMHVAHPLREGESVPLTLIVETAGGKRESVTVDVPVRSLTTPSR
ncbi:MAG: copper chaperone PCu(A)C [Burkholderiales bacterium]